MTRMMIKGIFFVIWLRQENNYRYRVVKGDIREYDLTTDTIKLIPVGSGDGTAITSKQFPEPYVKINSVQHNASCGNQNAYNFDYQINGGDLIVKNSLKLATQE